MFDLGFWEIAVVCVIALVIVGPDRLPRLARTVGLWAGRARRVVEEVKRDIDRELREAELKEAAEKVDSAVRDLGDTANKIGRFTNQPPAADDEPDTASDTGAESAGDTKGTEGTEDTGSGQDAGDGDAPAAATEDAAAATGAAAADEKKS